MSEIHDSTACERFEEWLLEARPDDPPTWRSHLDACAGCRAQWQTHRMLAATLGEESVPEFSAAFDAGLERKLAATAVRVEALRGWRLAAMAGYALAGGAILRWLFLAFPLPALDPGSPWLLVAALLVVPLSFSLAIAATKLLPTQRPRRLRSFCL